MAEITFKITKSLGVISTNAKDWTKELNMVSWNDREPKYDIREWSPDHSRMSKGVSLTEDEMKALVELFNTRDEEDDFTIPEDEPEEKEEAAPKKKAAPKKEVTKKAPAKKTAAKKSTKTDK